MKNRVLRPAWLVTLVSVAFSLAQGHAQQAMMELQLDSLMAAAAPPILPPREVRVGQTVAEVEAALGKPDHPYDASGKKIYVYKNPPLKVIFMDGRVVKVAALR